MKKKNLTKMIIQCGILIAFAGGIYGYVMSNINPQEVYKFSRDIPINTILQEGDLVKSHVPKGAVTPTMITKKEDIVGKAVTAKCFAQQPVIQQQLTEPENADPFESMDLSNYRKVSLAVPAENAVGGNLKKGDKVDLVSVRDGEIAGDAHVESKVFLQNVLVYSVIDDGGRQYIDTTEGNSVVMNENGEVVESGAIAIVTLSVTPQQAEQIEARQKAGEVKLIGRFEESVDLNTDGHFLNTSELKK